MELRKIEIPGDPVKFEVPGGLYTLAELQELAAQAEGKLLRYEARELQGYAHPYGVFDTLTESWITDYGQFSMPQGRAGALALMLNERPETRTAVTTSGPASALP